MQQYIKSAQDAVPASLKELLKTVDAAKRRLVLQRMAISLTPIVEKGLVAPVIVHR